MITEDSWECLTLDNLGITSDNIEKTWCNFKDTFYVFIFFFCFLVFIKIVDLVKVFINWGKHTNKNYKRDSKNIFYLLTGLGTIKFFFGIAFLVLIYKSYKKAYYDIDKINIPVQ